MNARKLSVLVLCDDDRAHAGNLLEHLAALQGYSRHRVRLYNARGVPRSRFLDLDAFDVVVIHYSLVITSDNYLAPWLRERIRAFAGLKVQFLQDEYRWVDDVTAMMRWLGIDVLFSIVPPTAIPALYDGRLDDVEIVPTLAGFVPEGMTRLHRLPPTSARPVDVGYRGRVLPYWIGALSQEKVAIARGFRARARDYGLRCDIAWSEADRLYGEDWKRFLLSCRTTLGTESGSSLTDFDGSVERATLAYLDQHPQAQFEEVFDAVLAPHEGNVVMNVISPRVFEAAVLRTGLVLFPGEYGGVLEPERHYIQLEKDFSNMDEVAAAIRDDRRLEELTGRTYDDVIASGRYSLRGFVYEFDAVLSRRAERRATAPRRRFLAARVERPVVTRSIFGVDLIESRQANQRRAVALTLIREQPALKALASAYLRDRALRRKFGKRRALEDFLRLGLLLREQQGKPLAADPFYVVPSLEDPGMLTFASRLRGGAAASPSPTVESVAAAAAITEHDRVPTILWNHSTVGALVNLQRTGRNPIGLQVGYYGLLGVYHFGVIEALAAGNRRLVVVALTPLLEPPSPLTTRSGPEVASQTPSTVSRSTASSSRQVMRLALRALRRRQARALVLLYLRSATFRKAARLRLVVSDLARLQALHDAWGARIGNVAGVDVSLREGGAELRFTTRMTDPSYFEPWEGLDHSQSPERVLWDHTPAGATLRLAEGTLAIGAAGTHEFRALEAAFAQSPRIAWAAVLPSGAERRRYRTPAVPIRPASLRALFLVVRVAADRRGRLVLARYLRRSRGTKLRPLLVDLVKLRALLGRSVSGGAIGRTVTDGCVTFVTNGTDRDPLPKQGPQRLRWDHSEVGTSVLQAGVALSLGPAGVYEFGTLVRVMRGAAESQWEALLPSCPERTHTTAQRGREQT
ncbi:MAG: hypothetical protein ABI927_01285 [Gaiellaceae bacterium]